MRWILSVFCVLLVALVVVPGAAQAQQREELPEEARQELEERGMTIEEARQRLRQLGIDPSNPEQAARRARQLGVPEARIQSLLQAARQRQGRDTTGVGVGQRQVPRNPPYPVLAGTPEIEPDSISVGQLPRDIEVRVPLRSANQIRRVQPGFLTAGGDSVQVQQVERVRGSVVNGTWRGRLTVPRDTSDGTWGLFVRASTRDTTVTRPPWSTGSSYVNSAPPHTVRRSSSSGPTT